MQVLTVPNWSFGRNRALSQSFDDILAAADVQVHYNRGDVDHNRTVTAFSGEWDDVRRTILALAREALPAIDLNRHVGVHPRIGALDVCPFVAMTPDSLAHLLVQVEELAAEIADRFDVPVYLYERSERGRHESALPELRKGGFAMLVGRELRPDFGPPRAHPLLGATVMGVREFLIAMNVNLRGDKLEVVRTIARDIRRLRQEGDPRFLGVRALGLPLASRRCVQVSMNLTLPDVTHVDPIVQWVFAQAKEAKMAVSGTELIGVIRDVDVATATHLPIHSAQIVKVAHAV